MTIEQAANPWTTVTCVTATCARCGAIPADEGTGFTPHFDSPEQAREQLAYDYAWRLDAGPGGEELLCRRCAAKDDCARLGHQPWITGPTLMYDGQVHGQTTWCHRCGDHLTRELETPLPGYPVPLLTGHTLYWDDVALPDGEDIAAAAARLLGRMSDDAVAACWDAWPGDQTERPHRSIKPDPQADKAAAMILIRAAHQMLCAAVGVSIARVNIAGQEADGEC